MKTRHRFKSVLLSVALMVTAFGGSVRTFTSYATAAARTNTKIIEIDGKKFASPAGIVANGTTYMPIWYVMQALKQIGVSSTGNAHNWQITTSAQVQASGNPGHGSIGLYVNGELIAKVSGISAQDPSSGSVTTYIPVYYIMQILKQAGIGNTWDGTSWDIVSASADTQQTGQSSGGTVSGSASGSDTTDPNSISAYQGATSPPNDAMSDESYWQRASEDLYLGAQTTDPASSASGAPLLNVEPGQQIYLCAYAYTRDITKATFYVNSPDVALSTADANTSLQTGSGHIMTTAMMVPSKPGIYTVQAEADGEFSVPLVLIVGLDQLSGTPFTAPSGQVQGVLPLPTILPRAPEKLNSDGSSFFYFPTDINGWLPVKGRVKPGSADYMVVELGAPDNTLQWSYTLPVSPDGTFGALLRAPVPGQVQVQLIPHYFEDLNANGSVTPIGVYDATNSGPAAAETDQAMLASAFSDYNMNPEFNQTASVLMRNAPSIQAGVAAIANVVGEKITFDWKNFSANILWQNSTTVWQSNSGVDIDIAELAVSMYRSIGIPAETVTGKAPLDASPDSHEWIRVWVNNAWEPIDPSWNSLSDPNASTDIPSFILVSDYMGLTSAMSSTHQEDPALTGISE